MGLLLSDEGKSLSEWDGYGCERAVSLDHNFHFLQGWRKWSNKKTRASPSPYTLDAYQLAAAKTNSSISPSHIAGGVFVSGNSTSTAAQNSTASSTGTGSIASSSGSSSSSGASQSGTGAGSSSGTKSGSGSGTGSNITTGGTSPSSPGTFQGAASKTATGLSVACGAAALFLFALV